MNFYTSVLSICITLAYIAPTSYGVRCWICFQAKSNRDCIIRGHTRACNPHEGCENEVRYTNNRISITKRCKQLQACSNDQLQNSMMSNNKYQCGAQRQNSVCRCCCNSDSCNKDQLSCLSQDGNPKCRFLFLPNGSTRCFGSMDGSSLGTRCQFRCKAGYDVKGAKSVSCERRGIMAEWSEPVPRCEKKPTCVRIYGNSIANGFVRCSGIYGLPTLGTACVFRCKPRYFMINENKRKTVSNYEKTVCALGKTNAPTWTRKPPNCIEEMCPIVTTMQNGFVTCTNTNRVGSVCAFECSPGYKLVGQETITCQQRTGMKLWNARPPTCQPKPCPAQSYQAVLLDVDCTDHNRFGSICSFTCRKGYYLADPIHQSVMKFYTTTCVLSGKEVVWSHDVPICLPKKCPALSDPENGIVKCPAEERYLHTKCTFACTSLVHEIAGERTLECFDDGEPGNTEGTWSHPQPKCQLKKCAPINMVATNVKCNKGYVYRSTCAMSCKDGYHMVARDGNTIMKASATRARCVLREQEVVWSKPPPTCEQKRCREISPPLYASMTCSDTDQYGSVCSFVCENGFELNGEAALVCEERRKNLVFGKWSGSTPSCERRSCPKLYEDTISSNLTCTDSARYESECTIHCQPGYFMRTPEGYITDRAKTACGYTEEGMLWDTRVPTCQPKTCDAIGGIANGEMICSVELIYSARCEFKCNRGYLLEGSSSVTCEDAGRVSEKGTWSSEPPVCTPRKCSLLPYDTSTMIASCSKNRDYASECSLNCKPRHFIRTPGSDNVFHDMKVNCELDETDEMKWNPKPMFCEPVTCPVIDIPTVYSVCTNGNRTNSKCTFTCPIGYDLVGNLTNKCQQAGQYNAKWRHPLPYCQIRTCLDLVSDKATEKTCTRGSDYQSECSFHCLPNRGLFMTYAESSTVAKSGVTVLQCAIDKQGRMYWTGDLPRCNVKFCIKLRPPKNGQVSCNRSSRYRSRCKITCSYGYKLEGRETLICKEGRVHSPVGSWSHDMPVCKRK